MFIGQLSLCQMSFGQLCLCQMSIYQTSYRQMSIGYISLGQMPIIHRSSGQMLLAKCPLAKNPFAKCQSAKCPLAKCPSAKCLPTTCQLAKRFLIKCLSTTCQLDKCFLIKRCQPNVSRPKGFWSMSANQMSVGQMVFDQKMRHLQKWTLKTFNKVLTSKTFDQRLDSLRRFNPLDFYQSVQCSSKWAILLPYQGSLTEGEGSVQLTSSYELV